MFFLKNIPARPECFRHYLLTTPRDLLRDFSGFGLLLFRSPLLKECARKASIFFFSSAYWDVSLQRVRSTLQSSVVTRYWIALGFPIRKSPVQRLLSTSPRLIAATLRPSSSRHPKASTIRPYESIPLKQDTKIIFNFQFSKCCCELKNRFREAGLSERIL